MIKSIIIYLLLSLILSSQFFTKIASSQASNSSGIEKVLVFVSPYGSGNFTGKGVDNSLPFAQIGRILSKKNINIEIQFSDGFYFLNDTLQIPDRGKNFRTIIRGGENSYFYGNFDFLQPDDFFSAFEIGTSNVVIENFQLHYVGRCIVTKHNSNVENIEINNLSVTNVRDCIFLDRSSQGRISNWTITNVKVKGYYQTAMRFAGPKTGNISINNVEIDGQNYLNQNYCWKTGIQLLKGIHNVSVKNAEIKNVVGNCEAYEQGDGIEADDQFSTPYNLKFENIVIENSRDGNIDLKADFVKLRNIYSKKGPNTRFSYRFWNYNRYYCKDCRSNGATNSIIFSKDAYVQFENANFDVPDSQIICDTRVSEEREQTKTGISFIDSGSLQFDKIAKSLCVREIIDFGD